MSSALLSVIPRERPSVATERSQAAACSPRTIGAAFVVFARHGSPRVLLIGVMISAAIRVRMGEWSVWDLAVIAITLVAWPIQEWILHVCLLHCPPITLWGRSYEFRIPRIHRAHHRDPWNYDILFIPLHAFVYIFSLNLLLWLMLAPTVPLAFTGATFALVLSLHYEWIHFLIHTRVSPRTRFYQRLWRNHRLHHFKNEHYWYGVTRLEGDRLLRTGPPPETVAVSPTARTLIEAPSANAG